MKKYGSNLLNKNGKLKNKYHWKKVKYWSKEYNSDISFQFVKVSYDIEKELED